MSIPNQHDNNFNTLKNKITEVISFSPGKLELEIEEALKSEDMTKELSRKWYQLFIDICYGREECKELGVNYHSFDLDPNSYQNRQLMILGESKRRNIAGNRMKVLALYLIRENPDFVLPY